MTSKNVETYRAGHEAFNRRDFGAMTSKYAGSIGWTDHSQGRTFRTPGEFRADFLAGWVAAAPRYSDRGDPVPGRPGHRGLHVHRPRHPASSSVCRSARCGTSTQAGMSSAETSTTTRSRC